MIPLFVLLIRTTYRSKFHRKVSIWVICMSYNITADGDYDFTEADGGDKSSHLSPSSTENALNCAHELLGYEEETPASAAPAVSSSNAPVQLTSSLAFAPDGKQLAVSWQCDKFAVVHCVETPYLRRCLPCKSPGKSNRNIRRSVAFTPDGEHLLCSVSSPTKMELTSWNVRSLQRVKSIY